MMLPVSPIVDNWYYLIIQLVPIVFIFFIYGFVFRILDIIYNWVPDLRLKNLGIMYGVDGV